jgi:hypothetical protein
MLEKQTNVTKAIKQFVCLAALSIALPTFAVETTPAAQLDFWEKAAGQPGNPSRGQTFFTQKHGGQWACASCHGAPPIKAGEHADTGKRIKPLAPAYNTVGFTKQGKTDKWFRRNCNDVVGRECTPSEKSDVLSYLINIK